MDSHGTDRNVLLLDRNEIRHKAHKDEPPSIIPNTSPPLLLHVCIKINVHIASNNLRASTGCTHTTPRNPVQSIVSDISVSWVRRCTGVTKLSPSAILHWFMNLSQCVGLT
jgi:hypothetical protein